MPLLNPIRFNSILGGWNPSKYIAREGGILGSIGIDPDFPVGSDIRTSGQIVPTVYEKFSGANVNGTVIAIITEPKDTKTYVVQSNGRLISYDNALGTETLVGTVAGSSASGAFYYNNYIYITGTGASFDDVSRYGPLNGAAALTDNVWKGATLGTKTALTNTTYPTLRGISMPNHPGFAHSDGSAYFVDFANGKGMVHRINTKKVTVEGDTNGTTVPSLYNALDLQFGFYPTAIAPYRRYVVILAQQSTDSTVAQGKSALFVWDPTNATTFDDFVLLPDPIGTALLNHEGRLIVFTGNAQGGVRVSEYAGGDNTNELAFLEEGLPPLCGAVETLGNRIMWGGFTTYPANSASVFSIGSKRADLPQGIHNIICTTSAGANQMVTAIRNVQQANFSSPRLIVSWKDGTSQGIDRFSTTATYVSRFRSELVPVNSVFSLNQIRIPLGAAVSANTTITVKVWLDDESSSVTLPVINNTNYSGKRVVNFKQSDLLQCRGVNNFLLEFIWSGTSQLPVLLPIEMIIERFNDEP